MDIFNDFPEIFYLGFYHPLYSDFEENEYSETILNLKKRDSEAIDFFLNQLCQLMSDEDISVTTVPPHSSSSSYSGIRDLAQRLVKSKKGFNDATLCLNRFKTIDKLSSSSSSTSRNLNIHLNSIKINHPELVKDKKVILIDDVLTTGNSVEACKELLMKAGAKTVKIIVLGKTIRGVEKTHYLIESKLEEYLAENDYDDFYRQKQIDKYTDIQLQELCEEIKAEHEKVDEWASDEHDNLDSEDWEEHYYIDQEANERHQSIDYDHAMSSTGIIEKAEEEKPNNALGYSCEKFLYETYAQDAHSVVDGETCFSIDNPFIILWK
jgi:hypoxanthine phosphoribosyltransferase